MSYPSVFFPWSRLPGWAAAGLLAALALVAGPGQAGAEPALFDSLPDPRTVGELPPVLAAPAESLHPSLETPGGDAWLRGEVPSGVAAPGQALRGANATAGIRLPLVTGTDFSWEVKPMLTGSASAAARPETSAVLPGLGVALGQSISLSLPFGLRLGAEGTVGDRLGVGLGDLAAAPSASALAMRAGATLSTDLALPFLGTPMHIGLGVTAAGPLPGGASTAAYWHDAPDCTLSLEIAKVGGAPLRISSRCPGATGSVPPISFGFRTEF